MQLLKSQDDVEKRLSRWSEEVYENLCGNDRVYKAIRALELSIGGDSRNTLLIWMLRAWWII